jgi:NADP-dependent 3-hydroxy acid dehydrogenase YdfG
LIDVNVCGVLHAFDAGLPHLRCTSRGAHAIAMASTSTEYGSLTDVPGIRATAEQVAQAVR